MGGTYHIDTEIIGDVVTIGDVVFTYSSGSDKPESYHIKLQRLAKEYPAVAEAKAHLDALMTLVENGE